MIEIVYQSPRKLEHLGIGIIKGIASHYRQTVNVQIGHHSDKATLIKVESSPAVNTFKSNAYDHVSLQNPVDNALRTNRS